jgi:branched-chain amino acid transport system permease protein
MSTALLFQFCFNGAMLGTIYAMVAVGFTLFFGVLDVIKFSHGDVLMAGAFAALTASLVAASLGLESAWLMGLILLASALLVTMVLGALVARVLVLPLRGAPALNTLLITLMFGTVLREAVRLFFPNGANPKPFPALLPAWQWSSGELNLRLDSAALLMLGLAAIAALHFAMQRTRLGLAIRAVAQDAEVACCMGIDFRRVVVLTFAIGSALAALAGVMNGAYYNEINFAMGLNLGVIGFTAAVVGGLGNFYGAVLGGFVFAALQTIGAAALPFGSAYKDVFAFAAVIVLIGWRPTGLLAERMAERV